MTRRRKVSRGRIGSLMLIAILMIASAVLRFGVSAPAIAREMASPPALPEDAPNGGTPRPEPMATADPQLLLDALQKRERALAARETGIEDRMKALAIAEAAIDGKLAELTAAEARLKATLALADGAAEGDLARLTDVYEKMKPKESAVLFAQMDPGFAAGFLARMTPETAAGILAGMQPQAAYAISVILAGRNTSVPKE